MKIVSLLVAVVFLGALASSADATPDFGGFRCVKRNPELHLRAENLEGYREYLDSCTDLHRVHIGRGDHRLGQRYTMEEFGDTPKVHYSSFIIVEGDYYVDDDGIIRYRWDCANRLCPADDGQDDVGAPLASEEGYADNSWLANLFLGALDRAIDCFWGGRDYNDCPGFIQSYCATSGYVRRHRSCNRNRTVQRVVERTKVVDRTHVIDRRGPRQVNNCPRPQPQPHRNPKRVCPPGLVQKANPRVRFTGANNPNPQAHRNDAPAAAPGSPVYHVTDPFDPNNDRKIVGRVDPNSPTGISGGKDGQRGSGGGTMLAQNNQRGQGRQAGTRQGGNRQASSGNHQARQPGSQLGAPTKRGQAGVSRHQSPRLMGSARPARTHTRSSGLRSGGGHKMSMGGGHHSGGGGNRSRRG